MNQNLSNYRKLKVWQLSYELSLQVYKVTKEFPEDERFGLASQMRRCAVSICSNIAEGSGRESSRDKSHFYTIAKGSANELEAQTLIAHGLSYLPKDDADQLSSDCVSILKMLTKLIQTTNQTPSSKL